MNTGEQCSGNPSASELTKKTKVGPTNVNFIGVLRYKNFLNQLNNLLNMFYLPQKCSSFTLVIIHTSLI